jgi:hypothetical protein
VFVNKEESGPEREKARLLTMLEDIMGKGQELH